MKVHLNSSWCTRRNKTQKSYIKTNSVKFKIGSVRWPPSTHGMKKIRFKFKKPDSKNHGFYQPSCELLRMRYIFFIVLAPFRSTFCR